MLLLEKKEEPKDTKIIIMYVFLMKILLKKAKKIELYPTKFR